MRRGDPRVGGTLSCDRGKWDDTADARYDYDFFWIRDYGEEIDGAYSSTYVVTGADAGVDLQALAAKLQADGAASFVASWHSLMAVIASKSAGLAQAGR